MQAFQCARPLATSTNYEENHTPLHASSRPLIKRDKHNLTSATRFQNVKFATCRCHKQNLTSATRCCSVKKSPVVSPNMLPRISAQTDSVLAISSTERSLENQLVVAGAGCTSPQPGRMEKEIRRGVNKPLGGARIRQSPVFRNWHGLHSVHNLDQTRKRKNQSITRKDYEAEGCIS